MISSQDAAVLERILRREGRSLLQYLSEAFPWTRTGTGENLANLQQVICEERDAIAALGRFFSEMNASSLIWGRSPWRSSR